MTTSTREEIRLGELALRFLLESEDSDGTAAIFEFDVPAGAKVPIAHSHDAYEETMYGLEGVLTVTVDGEPIALGPGDAVCIRGGFVHRFDNLHDADSKVLAIVTPGVLGPQYFRDVQAVVAAAAGVPPDLAAMADVMRRHGLTPAP